MTYEEKSKLFEKHKEKNRVCTKCFKEGDCVKATRTFACDWTYTCLDCMDCKMQYIIILLYDYDYE